MADAFFFGHTSRSEAGISLFLTLLLAVIICVPIACSSGTNNQDTSGDDPGGDSNGSQPSCHDGIQNQDETDVDCGGSCDACYSGTVYYIANGGNDNEDGLSPETAWKTIARVNRQVLFEPGDAVLFKRGDVWREELVITWSGEVGAHITFGAYGTGDKPSILGSEQAENWTAVSGHTGVWQAATPLDAPLAGHPASIFFGEDNGDTTWGRVQNIRTVNACGTDFANLQQEYDWCWEDNMIYIQAPENPDTRYTFIEVPQRRGAITMQSQNPMEYITIDGLELMYGTMYGYSDGWPMDYEVRGLTIKNCHVGYIGIRGGDSAMGLTIWHSDMLVSNNEIHDCGRRNISYNVYTDNGKHTPDLVFENVVFDNNVLYHGYHTTGFDISHGDAMFDIFRNFTFSNNFIWDDPVDDPTDAPNDFTSMGIYLESGSGLFTNFTIYNNILMHLKQKSLAISGVDNLAIYNNTIYGTNPNIDGYRPMVSISGDNANLRFNNNIVHGTVSADDFVSRCVYIGSGNTQVTSMDNNLYFQDDDRQVIHHCSSTNYHIDDWSQYQQDTGWDLNSPPPQHPLFHNASKGDFRLQSNSPAHNTGVAVDDRLTDFYGNPIIGVPDIGAIELQDDFLE